MSEHQYQPHVDKTTTSTLQIGVVVARWNEHITSLLLGGCLEGLAEVGVHSENIHVVYCPGSFEIPVLVSHFVANAHVDAVVAIGVIIRGDTAHFEYVAEPVSHALQSMAVESGVPIGFCVLTTNTEQQALDRAGGIHGNKGYESALSVVETVQAIGKISGPKS